MKSSLYENREGFVIVDDLIAIVILMAVLIRETQLCDFVRLFGLCLFGFVGFLLWSGKGCGL